MVGAVAWVSACGCVCSFPPVVLPQELAGYTGGDVSFIKEDFELQLNKQLVLDSVSIRPGRCHLVVLSLVLGTSGPGHPKHELEAQALECSTRTWLVFETSPELKALRGGVVTLLCNRNLSVILHWTFGAPRPHSSPGAITGLWQEVRSAAPPS